MDMGQFRRTMDANHWKECLMAIIFDNSMRWIFNQCEKHFDKKLNLWITDRWIPPEEVLIFDDANECIKMKERFAIKDKSIADYDKWYFYSVCNVENVQRLIFCDMKNKEIRPFFDTDLM